MILFVGSDYIPNVHVLALLKLYLSPLISLCIILAFDDEVCWKPGLSKKGSILEDIYNGDQEEQKLK